MSKAVKEAQERLQSTMSGEQSDASDEENDSDVAPASTVACEGSGGCGEHFPIDQHGSDARFNRLCAACIKKSSGIYFYKFLFFVIIVFLIISTFHATAWHLGATPLPPGGHMDAPAGGAAASSGDDAPSRNHQVFALTNCFSLL